MSVSAIILAAGRSTRIKSARPKALHEISGRAMLGWVLEACYEAGVDKVMVVIGHGKDEIIAQFGSDSRIQWVEQTEQLGTGHAARMCQAELVKQGEGEVFILAGDGPLIRGQVLKTLLDAHHTAKVAGSMATAVLANPFGYGRITRDASGEFLDIVEEADCTPEQRKIQEVFPSYYCMQVGPLLAALGQLTNHNKKHEYYLTDIFGILRRAGQRVLAVQAVTAEDVLAVNDRIQQADVERIMQGRIHQAIRSNGVTIVSSEGTYIEAGVSVGQDTIIQPFSYIGRNTTIGSNCIIGPFACVSRDSIVPDESVVTGNVAATVSVD